MDAFTKRGLLKTKFEKQHLLNLSYCYSNDLSSQSKAKHIVKNLFKTYVLSDDEDFLSSVEKPPQSNQNNKERSRSFHKVPAHSAMNSFRWLLPRSLQRRILFKNGDCNISLVHINKRGRHYLADLFTTLIDFKWRLSLLIFLTTFASSWILFGFIWWTISYAHGDIENRNVSDWKPCVNEVYDFQSALLFSVETQQTIGYGTRNVTPNCAIAIIIVMIQSCFGIIIQALMTGLVFAKMSRPKKRAQTLMFSQKAVICERDDQLCLLFRVADMRKSQIVEAHVRAIMVCKRVTKEGEVLPFYQKSLKLETSDDEGRLFLVWPATVEHRITPDSPLWDISATDLIHRHFEILVIMEGIVESTGMTTQARTSYLPSEILWGYRFNHLVSYKPEEGQYVVDFSQLNSTSPVAISGHSAKRRSECQENQSSLQLNKDTNYYYPSTAKKYLYCSKTGNEIRRCSCDVGCNLVDQSKIVAIEAASRVFNIAGATPLANVSSLKIDEDEQS